MINQETAATLLEKLDKNKKEIEIILDRISIFDVEDAYYEKLVQTLVSSLEAKEEYSRIIQDLLVLEFEHLEIEPILEQLSA